MVAARRGTQKSIPVDEAKRKVLDGIGQGMKVDDACRMVNRSPETYRDWMRSDSKFKAAVQELRQIRAATAIDGRESVVPDFETFCRDWLKEPLYPHHRRIVDVIEGRVPADEHPSVVFTPGMPGYIVANMPPSHGKTSQITTNYVVWRIHRDPSISVMIISKSKDFAENILWDIKRILTDSMYREMHTRFAPEGGWQGDIWAADKIYVNGKAADGKGEKDPTVQATGMKGQIYGRRAHLIIVDDAVDETNVGDHERQQRWLMKTVRSRLPSRGGTMVIVGTRMGATDLYKNLRDLDNIYADDGGPKKVFSYLGQPAVLDYGDGPPETWETLWPTVEIDGETRPLWGGKELSGARAAVGEREWALVYQQQDVLDDAIFTEAAVGASINRNRFPGVMSKGVSGHRAAGMDGLYVIGGLDPAPVGHTAMIVLGLDRGNIRSDGQVSAKRWVIDGANVEGISLSSMQSKMKELTELHGINEWVIEQNAAQRFLLQDTQLNDWMRNRGVRMTPHSTQGNKLDPDFGVMGMAALFASCGVANTDAPGLKRVPWADMLIELPSPQQNAWVSSLITQLITWAPSDLKQKQKTDLVMALWFTMTAVDRILGLGRKTPSHLKSRWSTASSRSQQRVVNLQELLALQLMDGRTA